MHAGSETEGRALRIRIDERLEVRVRARADLHTRAGSAGALVLDLVVAARRDALVARRIEAARLDGVPSVGLARRVPLECMRGDRGDSGGLAVDTKLHTLDTHVVSRAHGHGHGVGDRRSSCRRRYGCSRNRCVDRPCRGSHAALETGGGSSLDVELVLSADERTVALRACAGGECRRVHPAQEGHTCRRAREGEGRGGGVRHTGRCGVDGRRRGWRRFGSRRRRRRRLDLPGS